MALTSSSPTPGPIAADAPGPPDEAEAPQPPTTTARFRPRTLALLLMAESLVLALVQLPLTLNFKNFVLGDPGANLTVQRLLDRGLVPIVDFGYQYGLAPLLLGRAWFAVLGRTPQAYAAAMIVFDLLIAWGLARCAHALRSGPAGVALLLCAMPMAALALYLNLAHACEAVLLCHALADHAGGRRGRALALLTTCLFMKPVMAYLYGFLLVLLVLRSGGTRGLVRAAVPAAATGAAFFLALSAWFGPAVVVGSLLAPIHGSESYHLMNYGFFFGTGRRFWLPDGVTPQHYLSSPAGHYLAGTIVLAVAAAVAVWRLARRPATADDAGAEALFCCGAMHVLFLTSFYGSHISWIYYYDILIVGLLATAAQGRRWAVVVALLAVAALAGNKYLASNIKHGYRDMSRGADTFGLWATGPEHDEWRAARRALGDRKAAFVHTGGGCLELFVPQLADAENFFFVPGYPPPAEIRRKRQQLADADAVLTWQYNAELAFLRLWPEFRADMAAFELAWSGSRFQVFHRASTSRKAHAPPQPGVE